MMQMMMKCCLALAMILCFQSLSVSADIYTWTDEKGVKHFSNEPPPMGETAKRREELKHDVIQYEKWNEERQRRQDNMLKERRSAAVSGKRSANSKVAATKNPGNVVMYSTPTCGYCTRAKSFFNKHNISYTEYDITADPKAAQRFKTLKGRGVPLILVGDRRIPGFNKPLLMKLFGIASTTAKR